MTTPSDDTGRTRSRRRPERVTPTASGGYPPDEFDVDYEPGQRRGAHRTATPAVLEQLPWLVVALVAVVAVVAAIVLLTGGDDPEAGGPAPTTSATATAPAGHRPRRDHAGHHRAARHHHRAAGHHQRAGADGRPLARARRAQRHQHLGPGRRRR